MKKDIQITESWKKNSAPWIKAIEGSEIKSRVLVTDQAIVNAILSINPDKILDIGCGEGWLVRKLEENGIEALGIDVVPELIEQAKSKNQGRFKLLSYEKLTYGSLNETFDGLTCNFSLLGKESVEHVFSQSTELLNTDGYFIIQTIHPIFGCGKDEYEDGWREGSWSGFNDEFTDPPPWYFRTIESWKELFLQHKFTIKHVKEPIHPNTNVPASIVFIAKKIR
jgi:2-polyprenyl-3-methyl-5-hydroxy-6-metoxy-1,4-benzoquinol methylase